MTSRMQNYLNILDVHLGSLGLNLSPGKTQSLLFARSPRKRQHHIPLTIGGNQIQRVKSAKFLGMRFDELANWKPHVEEVGQKCDKVLNVMRAISGLKWGANKSLLLNLYRTCIRPLLDFGCEGLDFAPPSTKSVLEKIQNKALGICCGSIRGTPTAALQVECGEPPIDLRRRRLVTHLAAKTQLTGCNPTSEVYFLPDDAPQWIKRREECLRTAQARRNPNGSGPYFNLLINIIDSPPPPVPPWQTPNPHTHTHIPTLTHPHTPTLTQPNTHPPTTRNVHHKLKILKILTHNNLLSEWQSRWDRGPTGRALHNIQPEVKTRIQQMTPRPSREKDVTISRLRMGHSRLNATLHKLGLHPTGHCKHCPGVKEDVAHFLTACPARADLHTTLPRQPNANPSLQEILTNNDTCNTIYGWIKQNKQPI